MESGDEPLDAGPQTEDQSEDQTEDQTDAPGAVGVEAELEPPDVVGLADLVSRAVFYRPGRVALVEESGRSLTWAEVDDQVTRVASGLASLGVVAGYRVLLALGNRVELVTSYLGTLRAHAVAVPVNPGSTAEELERMVEDCAARVVIADATSIGAVRAALARRTERGEGVRPRLVVVGLPAESGERSWEELREAAGDTLVELPPLLDPEALAVILYTSGTSGRPRGAMLSHRALLANLDQVNAVRPAMFFADDVVLGVLPLFHVYGLNGVLGAVLRHRARLVLAERFDPQGSLDLADEHECSVLPVAPAAIRRWLAVPELAQRLTAARLVLSGSAPLDPATAAAFTARTGIEVHEGYGLTEAAPVVTSTLGRPRKAGSVGRPLPGVRLRLVDPAGRPAEPGDPGEIEVNGANLFDGYWPDGVDGPSARIRGGGRWWATGDVGLLDEDGDLFLVDRVRELVIVSGFNVYPGEVEEVLAEVEGVAAVAVIGIPDERTGEAVAAYVVATPDRAEDPAALLERLGAHAARRLARFKRPARLELVARLPTTVTGKVQKGRLRAAVRREDLSLLEEP